MEEGKGWHNEYTRHSEARLYGRTSGTKLKAPSMKGRTLKFVRVPYGKKSTPEHLREYKLAGVPNSPVGTKEEIKEFYKERKEHPTFSDPQIKQIVKDHEPAERETTLYVPFSYSAGGSRKEVETILDKKIEASGHNTADFDYDITPEKDLKAGNSGVIEIHSSPEKIKDLKKELKA
jgi:hypothetical protein